jgi:hypothetical protein
MIQQQRRAWRKHRRLTGTRNCSCRRNNLVSLQRALPTHFSKRKVVAAALHLFHSPCEHVQLGQSLALLYKNSMRPLHSFAPKPCSDQVKSVRPLRILLTASAIIRQGETKFLCMGTDNSETKGKLLERVLIVDHKIPCVWHDHTGRAH